MLLSMSDGKAVLVAAYEEGYSAGVSWDRAWTPGGPWSDGSVRASEIRDKWRSGFTAGRQQAIELLKAAPMPASEETK